LTPDSEQRHRPPHQRRAALAFILVAAFGVAIYARGASTNPPGFYIDESSIAYNAESIARTGRDEHGEAWPLFFRAFGDYKNPTYIYLLAALFRLTGPSIAVARLLSAALGVAAALLLGLLGARVARSRLAGVLVCATALLTPWLFELSRVAVEVAMYPLALALFLLAARRASERERWDWTDALALSLTLALLTYTYSIGRLLGPLLAFGLALFAARARLRGLLLAWAAYALALVPLLVFQLRNPGALAARFRIITYVTPQSTAADDALEFLRHYAANLNPWRMLVAGDPNAHQIASIYNTGPVLAATFALAVAGAFVALRGVRRESSGLRKSWELFVVYCLAASFVPASLTTDDFHTLRLAAVPVFLVALSAHAFARLLESNARGEEVQGGEREEKVEGGARASQGLHASGGARARQALLVAAVALTVAQGLVFRWQYGVGARSPRRLHLFDADYTALILPTALEAAGERPVLLADAPAIPGYIQARWYATLRRIPQEKFVLLAPGAGAPAGAVVITTEDSCPRCRVLARSDPYTTYVAEGEPRVYSPLDAGGFRAELSAVDPPSHLRAGEQANVRVVVKNTGDSTWLARERGASPLQLSAGNHWLDAAGDTVSNDDGRAPLLKDLRPGEETELRLVVNAPRRPGDYLLEIDMLQEGVSWFGLKGSRTLRLPVKVE
jgi:4-amino-4-deoxy-L-arabinose transferase-like glycosyltransferase